MEYGVAGGLRPSKVLRGSGWLYEFSLPLMHDYFTYLPDHPAGDAWGVVATSAGFTRRVRHDNYPPKGHPSTYDFNWAKGRILCEYHIVLISEGEGIFESAAGSDPLTVKAGQVFLLFPGIWHRYHPSPSSEIGWTEHWIGMKGLACDAIRKKGIITPVRPLFDATAGPGVAGAFAEIHGHVASDALGNQMVISTLGFHLMSLLVRLAERLEPDPLEAVVQRARMMIRERCDQAVPMEQIAHELNLSYSHFTKIFRARTGVTPKQFQLNARMHRARDLVANTDKPLKEIAWLLGYHSAFHFSHHFKSTVGSSPTEWRKQIALRNSRKIPPEK